MPILDPKTHTVTFFKMPVRDPKMPESLGPGHAGRSKADGAFGLLGRREDLGHAGQQSQLACSTSKGRVWLAAAMRGIDNPAFCKKGSDHPSAKVFPLDTIVAPGRDARSARR